MNEEELLFLVGDEGNTFDADVEDQLVQDLALNDPNIFQADDCDAFNSDVDDEPTVQTIFMANLSSAVSSPQQSGPSNSSVISEVLKLYDMCKRVDEPKIPNDVQQTNVVESDDVDMRNSNVIPIEQHVNHSKESVVLSGASSVINDDVVHEQNIPNKVQQTNVVESDTANMGNNNVIPYEQYVKQNDISVVSSSASSIVDNDCELHENTVFIPDDSMTTRLNILKYQVTIYEQRAKFELTDMSKNNLIKLLNKDRRSRKV